MATSSRRVWMCSITFSSNSEPSPSGLGAGLSVNQTRLFQFLDHRFILGWISLQQLSLSLLVFCLIVCFQRDANPQRHQRLISNPSLNPLRVLLVINMKCSTHQSVGGLRTNPRGPLTDSSVKSPTVAHAHYFTDELIAGLKLQPDQRLIQELATVEFIRLLRVISDDSKLPSALE